MPDVLEMIASNPEMAQSLDQGSQAPASPGYTLAPMSDKQAGDYQDTMAKMPTIMRARAQRTGAILSDPELMGSIETHHQAVADANALHHQASQELSYLHVAHTLHDTGAFYQEAHAISPNDPAYESKMMDLARRYPYAKPDAELMQPQHEARRTFLSANSAIEQRKADDDVQKSMDKGHLKMDDLNNPAYRTPNGGLNYQALKFLAGSRAGQSQMPNEFQRELIKTYGQPGSTAYNKLYQKVQKGDVQSTAIHNAYWTALKQADPGLAQRLGEQSGTAPAAANAPISTSKLYDF